MAGNVPFVRRLLLCVIGVVALAACGDNSTSSPAAAPAAPFAAATSATAVPGPSSVPESLALSAPRVGGGTVNLATYAGKPVVLWFWAPT